MGYLHPLSMDLAACPMAVLPAGQTASLRFSVAAGYPLVFRLSANTAEGLLKGARQFLGLRIQK